MSLRDSSFPMVNMDVEAVSSVEEITVDASNNDVKEELTFDAESMVNDGIIVRRHVIVIYNHTFANKFGFDWLRLLEYLDQHADSIRPSAYTSGDRTLKEEVQAATSSLDPPIDVFDCIATLSIVDDERRGDAAADVAVVENALPLKKDGDDHTSIINTFSELNMSSTIPKSDIEDIPKNDEDDDDDEILHYKIVIVCSDQHHELPCLRAWEMQLKVLSEMPSLSIEYELYGPEFPAIRRDWMALIELQLKNEDERFREHYASQEDQKIWLDELLSPSLTRQIFYTGSETRRLMPDMASRWIGEMMEHETILSNGENEEEDDEIVTDMSDIGNQSGDVIQASSDNGDDNNNNNSGDDESASTSFSTLSSTDGYINPDSPPVQLLLIEDPAMEFTLSQMRSSWRPLFVNNVDSTPSSSDGSV